MPSKELLSKAVNNPAFRLAVQNAFNHIIITDTEGEIVFANKAAEEMTGYSYTEMIGENPNLWGGLMENDFYTEMWGKIKNQKEQFEGIITNKRKNGEKYEVRVIITPIIDVGGQLIGFIGTEEEINESKIDLSSTLKEIGDSLDNVNKKIENLRNRLGEKASKEEIEQFDMIKETNEKLLAKVRSSMYEN